MDSITDIHICNDLSLKTDFIEMLTNIGGLMADKISLGYRTIQIKLALENR